MLLCHFNFKFSHTHKNLGSLLPRDQQSRLVCTKSSDFKFENCRQYTLLLSNLQLKNRKTWKLNSYYRVYLFFVFRSSLIAGANEISPQATKNFNSPKIKSRKEEIVTIYSESFKNNYTGYWEFMDEIPRGKISNRVFGLFQDISRSDQWEKIYYFR